MLQQFRVQEGWSTFFLTWLMVLMPALTLYQTDLTTGLEILLLVASGGYLAGFFLAKSVFSGRVALMYSLVYGGFLIFYLVGSTFSAPTMLWNERIADIIWRQGDWVNKAVNGGTSRDSLIFVMHTAVIFWVLSFAGAWYTFREGRVWRVVLPSGILLMSIVYYYFGPLPLWLFLAFYVLLALLYVARTYLFEQEEEWAYYNVRYRRSTSGNFLTAAFLLSTFILVFSAQLPTPAASATLNDVVWGNNQPWRRFQDNWTRLFSSLRSYGSGTNDPFAGSISLGGPRNVGNSLIMDIFVPEKIPYAYWQSTVFVTYEDGQWKAPDGERVVHIPDDGLLRVPPTDGREVITQTVRNYLPNSGTVYGLPDVVGSDKQLYVTRQLDAQGDYLVSLVQSRFVLQQGDIYNVYSQFSRTDVVSLRQASVLYPAWIEPYLQVPNSITPETLALAEDITAGFTNPYDKAVAVQNYLRANITYNDQINAAPPGVEPIHYVLFDLKEGYCNYYASAMVMMLRSQGVPARFVAGYAAGEYVEDANVYRVRASDAHTWVEVYFPQYGWILFEPTASLSVVERPVGGDVASFEDGLDSSTPPETNREDFLPDDELDPNELPDQADQIDAGEAAAGETGWWAQLSPVALFRIICAVLVLALSAVALYLAKVINTRVEGNLQESYGRLTKWGAWLGLRFFSTHTPYERAEMLTQAVPDGRQPIRNLTQHFVLQTFSQHQEKAENFDSQAEWQTLRPLLLKQIVKTQWERLKNWRKR